MENAPTYFGPLSYTLASHLSRDYIEAVVQVPSRNSIRGLRLRLRTPGKHTIASVMANGKVERTFDPADESIDLTGLRGTVHVRVRYR